MAVKELTEEEVDKYVKELSPYIAHASDVEDLRSYLRQFKNTAETYNLVNYGRVTVEPKAEPKPKPKAEVKHEEKKPAPKATTKPAAEAVKKK